MNKEYEQRFQEAEKWTQSQFHTPLLVWSPIQLKEQIDHLHVVEKIVEDFLDGVIKEVKDLPGRCFLLTREASYVLMGLKIRHTLTIGNVHIDASPYFQFDHRILESELSEGYIPNKPAPGHAWITLQDGSIIDLTILASVRHARGAQQRSLKESIYHSGQKVEFPVEHRPLMVGFGYHLGVISAPFIDGDCEVYRQWFNDYNGFEFHNSGSEGVWQLRNDWAFLRFMRKQK